MQEKVEVRVAMATASNLGKITNLERHVIMKQILR